MICKPILDNQYAFIKPEKQIKNRMEDPGHYFRGLDLYALGNFTYLDRSWITMCMSVYLEAKLFYKSKWPSVNHD